MHQRPRPAPRSASAASNPSTNPERTNNPREPASPRTRSSVDLVSYTERAGGDTPTDSSKSAAAADRETAKLNQVIQNFHTKAALVICGSRASLPQVYQKNGDIKQNRWFNIILDDTDVLVDDLREWRRHDMSTLPPAPLVIETFVDSSQLTHSQALVITDDQTGRRWDVADAFASSADSSPAPTRTGARFAEVVLERWTIDLGDADGFTPTDLGDVLPNVYKKGVVLFRSLYAFARMLPAWRLYRRVSKQSGNAQALKVRFRIRSANDGMRSGQKDTLESPVCPSEHADKSSISEHYHFPPLLCAAGPLNIHVQYRANCDLSVADAEALLSSRFLGLDEGMAIPTLPSVGLSLPHAASARDGTEQRTANRVISSRPLLGGVGYGSLGTYQLAGQRRVVSHQSSLQADAMVVRRSDAKRLEEGSLPGESRGSRPPQDLLKNPPFKAGSVSSSPRPSPSPSTSLGRPGPYITGTGHQKRVSLNTLPQQALRTPSLTNDNAIVSSGSSAQSPRFSSSFAHRTRWQGSEREQKTAESRASSGRGSSSSKEKGVAAAATSQPKAGAQGSSGSLASPIDDYEDIAGFIGQLERAKDMPAFASPSKQGSHTINLSKYTHMREAGSQLAEDMQSSSLIQASSTPPSRRLSNVPGLSTSSSPSRALAHTPHVRSRLSTHSIAEEGGTVSSGRSGETGDSPQVREEEAEEGDDLPFIFQQEDL